MSETETNEVPGDETPDQSSETSNEQPTESGQSDVSANENSATEISAVEADPAGVKRRGILAGILGAVVGAIPALIAGVFFMDPLIKKWFPKSGEGKGDADAGVVKDADGRILLDVTLDALPEDGTPMSYTVYDDIVNAWNKFPNQPIGTIWLRRIKDAEPPVLAFSSICPHLGCAVEYRNGEGDFFCPCHTSSFDLEGKKNNEIPPRGMDGLEVKITDENKLWLQYKEYRGATPEQVEVS